MHFLKKLFTRKSDFVGDFIETRDGLIKLTQSNQIAAAELEQFEKRIKSIEQKEDLEIEATKSADALSGYGISVSPKAFIEVTEN